MSVDIGYLIVHLSVISHHVREIIGFSVSATINIYAFLIILFNVNLIFFIYLNTPSSTFLLKFKLHGDFHEFQLVLNRLIKMDSSKEQIC